jgi:hypothetical protein
MSEAIAKPWALMRHHAGWADIFRIEGETPDAVTGFYPDRETVGPHVTYSARAVLARFPTLEAARSAREGGVAEWRKHDEAVKAAQAALTDAEKTREEAWVAWLKAEGAR